MTILWYKQSAMKNKVVAGIIVIIGLLGANFSVFVKAQTIPAVETAGTGSVSANSAVLNATVNPALSSTNLWFEYGTTPNYGMLTGQIAIPAGNSQGTYSISVSNLNSGTTYYFRAVASNSYGTVYGQQRSFQTPSSYSGSGAPSISTNAVERFGSTNATFRAYASTQDIQSEAWFEYGLDANNLNQRTPSVIVQTTSYYAGTSALPFVEIEVTNLQPNTTYFYRAVIRNVRGTGYGQVLTFHTSGYSSFYTDQIISGGNTPTVTTLDPKSINSSGAFLSGSANPNGSPTWGWFEYGTTQNLGQKTSEISLGSGYSTIPFSTQVSGLLPGTLYYQRAAARNSAGTTYGPISFFRTWVNELLETEETGAGIPTYTIPSNTREQLYVTPSGPSYQWSVQPTPAYDYYYSGYTNGWAQEFAIYSANLNKTARAQMGNPMGSAAAPENNTNLAQLGTLSANQRIGILNLLLSIFMIAIIVFALRFRSR